MPLEGAPYLQQQLPLNKYLLKTGPKATSLANEKEYFAERMISNS